ncbi:MAG TPA: hypothetical protein VFG13_04135, partial [Blastococcus sp.]|nr:hypothetical protein [Blastococcus sp.]
MPLDLDRTTHVFAKLPDGGRQTVTADTPQDVEQIALIDSICRTRPRSSGAPISVTPPRSTATTCRACL